MSWPTHSSRVHKGGSGISEGRGGHIHVKYQNGMLHTQNVFFFSNLQFGGAQSFGMSQ